MKRSTGDGQLKASLSATAALVASLAALMTLASAASAGTHARVWTLTSPDSSPPARAGHAMAYDPVGKQVLVFGGYDDAGYLNDTWTWDGSTWTQQAPATSPAPWPVPGSPSTE